MTSIYVMAKLHPPSSFYDSCETGTHPDLLALVHQDLGVTFPAVIHGYYQQRVVGAAVQHGFDFDDGIQRNRIQLHLQNHIDALQVTQLIIVNTEHICTQTKDKNAVLALKCLSLSWY